MTDPAEWGIAAGYRDHRGEWRDTPQATVEALLGIMGADRPSPPQDDEHVRVVEAGDEVVLFGPGERGEPTVRDWARAAGTIGYEIVTRIGPRVRRTYTGSDAAWVC